MLTKWTRRGFAQGAAAIFLTASPTWEKDAMANDTQWKLTLPKSAESLTGNKKLVFDTWQLFWRGKIEEGLVNMTNDVTWHVPGAMKTSGLKDGKDAVRNFRKSNLNIFAEQHHTVVGIYGDGNVVVMEMSSKGRLRNGVEYENSGVTVWEVENGKVRRVREYVDTYKAMQVNAVVADPAPAAKP